MPCPRTNPEMIRPPENTSSIATDSATRSGLPCSGIGLPSMQTASLLVCATTWPPMTLTSGRPHGVWWCSLMKTPS